jgi:hypothetical protein
LSRDREREREREREDAERIKNGEKTIITGYEFSCSFYNFVTVHEFVQLFQRTSAL